VKRPKVSRENFDPRQKFAGDLVDFEAEKILDLCAGDEDGDAICKTTTTGRGMYLTRSAGAPE